ncbi:hypothetical protein CDCA_CDCA19G4701 [Cyanidium caldarium]|uniref:Sugar phosphate transporter domain-containing protein n=1 Tax=Cyanidium caldarium TaxID=2771 RepID=A0AAV9J305_CYACA|nr:hypothetical protein CDCA_CDCA19G4701 [Cyanidium caldarium]
MVISPSVNRAPSVQLRVGMQERQWQQANGGSGNAVTAATSRSRERVRSRMEAVSSALAYATCSVLLTLFNKAVFSGKQFDYPWFALAWQSAATAVLVWLSSRTGWTATKLRWDAELLRCMTVPNFFFVMFLFTNSRALRYLTLPVQVVFKSLAPVGITIFESVWHRDPIPRGVWWALLLCALGNVVAALGRGGLSLSVRGYLWALANLFANVMYLATLRTHVPARFSSLGKTFASAVLSLFWMIPLSGISGELGGTVLSPAERLSRAAASAHNATGRGDAAALQRQSALSALRHESPGFQLAFVLSGLLGTLISAASFWCVSATSGSTYSVVGTLNKVPVVVLGYFIFREPTTAFTWAGVAVSIWAGYLFTESKRRMYAANSS